MYVRVHLICRVSADHMVNGKVTTGVLVEPVIELQRTVLVNDDEVAIRDQTLDFPRRNNAVAIHLGGMEMTKQAQ